VEKPEDTLAPMLMKVAPGSLLTAGLVIALAAAGCRSDRSPAPATGQVERVVTTTPSATEIVAAAGGVDRLVGIDRYSEHPAEVRGLPVVGDFLSPSIEAILQLEPDLVVLDAVQSRTAEALSAGGVRTLVLRMHTVADALDGITAAGRALGTEREAAAARAAIERDLEAVRARGRARPQRVKALAVVDRELGSLRGLVAAGPGSYLDELLGLVGGDNVMSASAVRYAKISPETVIETDPEVVFDTVHADDRARATADWQELARVRAVKAGRVHLLGETFYVSPGPRVNQAVLGLEKLLYP
jgi:iron complex transport system substrate-binding protein